MNAKEKFLSSYVSENGHISAPELVELARDEDNAFHTSFEWCDSTAGKEYRLLQARKLLRVTVVHLPTNTDNMQVLVNVRDTRKQEEGAYYPVSTVLNSPSMLKMAFDAVSKQLEAAMRALKQLDPEPSAPVKVTKPKAA